MNNRRQNQTYRNRQDYNDYSHNYPRRNSMPTWAIVLLSVVGTAVAGVGAFSYFNKPVEQQPAPIVVPQPEPQTDNSYQPKPAHKPATNTASNEVKILSSTANYETVTKPVKSCKMVTKDVTVPNPNKNNGTTGALIGAGTGAVAGGIIGNQVKNGKGTVIGGLIGAATGAVAGNEIGKAQQPATITKQEQVQECSTVDKAVKSIANYTTTYRYQGNVDTVTTQKAYKSGSSVNINKLR